MLTHWLRTEKKVHCNCPRKSLKQKSLSETSRYQLYKSRWNDQAKHPLSESLEKVITEYLIVNEKNLFLDHRGEGFPVLQIITDRDNAANFSRGLEILKRLEPEACAKMKIVVSDMSKVNSTQT